MLPTNGIPINSKKTAPRLVFVYLGKLPDYLKYSLLINAKYNRIVLLCDTDNKYTIPNVSVINITRFYNNNAFISLADDATKNFRDGFWLKTIERFYVLAAYMKYYEMESVFHGEIDNIIFNLEDIADQLNKIGNGLFYPVLNQKIAGGSLMYINSVKELEQMCLYFDAQRTFKDDMLMLAEYARTSRNVFPLPSESNLLDENPTHKVYGKYIFDVASIGQYLFGIDLRNSRTLVFNRFQNINCKTDLSLVAFRANSCDGKIYVKTNRREYEMVNVHIHSKIFSKIHSDSSFIGKMVNRLNCGKSTLISLNVRNYRGIRNLLGYMERLYSRKKEIQ